MAIFAMVGFALLDFDPAGTVASMSKRSVFHPVRQTRDLIVFDFECELKEIREYTTAEGHASAGIAVDAAEFASRRRLDRSNFKVRVLRQT
jgi:hypothetical protein